MTIPPPCPQPALHPGQKPIFPRQKRRPGRRSAFSGPENGKNRPQKGPDAPRPAIVPPKNGPKNVAHATPRPLAKKQPEKTRRKAKRAPQSGERAKKRAPPAQKRPKNAPRSPPPTPRPRPHPPRHRRNAPRAAHPKKSQPHSPKPPKTTKTSTPPKIFPLSPLGKNFFPPQKCKIFSSRHWLAHAARVSQAKIWAEKPPARRRNGGKGGANTQKNPQNGTKGVAAAPLGRFLHFERRQRGKRHAHEACAKSPRGNGPARGRARRKRVRKRPKARKKRHFSRAHGHARHGRHVQAAAFFSAPPRTSVCKKLGLKAGNKRARA